MVKSVEHQGVLVRDLEELREAEMAATQALLGTTIALAEAEWYAPSCLPGWTRAHVATHLARNADAFVHLVATATWGTTPLYPAAAYRWRDIERGAHRAPLDLQTDLDASASRLLRTYADLSDLRDRWVVLWPGQRVRMSLLPLARLSEVVLHHFDLDCGFTPAQIDPAAAAWLLQWHAFWLAGDPAYPAIELVAESGLHLRVGAGHHRIRATGTDADLVTWLTGRQRPSQFGAKHLPTLPRRP